MTADPRLRYAAGTSRNAFALAAVIALSLSATACGGQKEYWHAQAVTSPDVAVTPTQIWVGGKKLWVRLDVQNGSKGTLIVNRDAITAHTASGQTVSRASGAGGRPGACRSICV